MGRKLDLLLHRRSFKTSKFKALVNLAIARLAVLKNQRDVRCSHGRSDVAQLLRLGHQERALLRVEHLIKDQNMLDVYVMIEGYCHILTERVALIENQKDCPQDLREAVSSMIFAASRCGDFPELQEIRSIFTQRYGREFAAASVELRNSCGVNTKMIQKMSTKLPSYEARLKVVREIGAEAGITVMTIDEPPVGVPEPKDSVASSGGRKEPDNKNGGRRMDSSVRTVREEEHSLKFSDLGGEEELSGSFKTRRYRDVATAAQAAFESAAYAAAAARAAVELARPESHHRGSGDEGSPRKKNESHSFEDERFSVLKSDKNDRSHTGLDFEKNTTEQGFSSDSEDEEPPVEQHKENREESVLKHEPQLQRSLSISSLETTEVVAEEKVQEKGISFDESDEESENEEETIQLTRSRFKFGRRSTLLDDLNNHNSPVYVKDRNYGGRGSSSSAKPTDFDISSGGEPDEKIGIKQHHPDKREDPVRPPVDTVGHAHEAFDRIALRSSKKDDHVTTYKMRTGHLNAGELQGKPHSNPGKPVSMRTRRGFRH
ncbi:hypothetical protein H6P81_002935 [Aristolochia fimbriata]|uniref:IST1-like protein n=1 Tax=Aristolochia fimbriata TaxID=158543 RepID=A0AAV7FEE7_ARIFI|nr:hypothetical protein H6P81_002935 [Aristolochia fimbriata]